MKDIKHPNILSLLDFHKDPKYIYIVTNFCNGGNLEEYLLAYKKQNNDNPLPENIALRIFR